MQKIIISKDQAFKDFLVKRGLVKEDTMRLGNLRDPEFLRGKHVFGALSIHLASYADKVTFAVLDKSTGETLADWTVEDFEQRLIKFDTYQVRKLEE